MAANLVVEVIQVVVLVDHPSVEALVSQAVVEVLVFPFREVEALVESLEAIDLVALGVVLVVILVVVLVVVPAVVRLDPDWVEDSTDSLEGTAYLYQECDSGAA